MNDTLKERRKRRKYFKSPAWYALRALVIERGGGRCECVGGYKNGGETGSTRCENPIEQIHHLTYPIFPVGDTIDNLQGLCRSCHASRHISSVLAKPDCCKYAFSKGRFGG